MTISLADARSMREPDTRPQRLAFKNDQAVDSPAGQMLAVDADEGLVTAIVSVTGIEDEVEDIIEPGAYRDTLTKRRPKVCWAHSWEHPVGRVLHIEELHPGDERLPSKTRDGKSWPRLAGALVATMQFNMKSTAGREAFEAVRFYSETGECEYSIGYVVPAGKSTKDKAGIRHIKALELFELSVVLFGAHTMTGTLSIKAAYASALEGKRLGHGTKDGIDYAALEAAQAKALPLPTAKPAPKPVDPANAKPADPDPDPDSDSDKPDSKLPDFSDGVMVAVYPDTDAADAVASAISGPDDTIEGPDLHVTLAFLGNTSEVGMSADEIRDAVTGAVEGLPALEGEVGGIGQFPDTGNGSPTWVPVDVPGLGLLREAIVDALGEEVQTDHGFTPHMTLGYDIGLIDPIEPTAVTFTSVRIMYGTQQYDIDLGTGLVADPVEEKDMDAATRKKKPTMPGEGDRYPIGNVADLTNAVQAFGRAKDTDKDKVKRWIIRRARELNAVNKLPDDWNVKRLLSTDGDTSINFDGSGNWKGGEWKAEGGADRNRGNAEQLRRYWVHGEGAAKINWGTPGDFDRCVGLVSEHMDPERAKGYCANRHKDATGAWPGHAASEQTGKAMAYDPSLDKAVEVKAYNDQPTSTGSYPFLDGSYELRMRMLHEAVVEALRGECVDEVNDRWEWNYVELRATWDGRCVVTRHRWGSVDESQDWQMTYSIVDGEVELGEPERVVLQVVALSPEQNDDEDEEPDADEDEDSDVLLPLLADLLPLHEDIDHVTAAIKSAERQRGETKAGRVLSGRNERRLRTALTELLDVLAASGVNVTRPEDDPQTVDMDLDTSSDARREIDPRVDLDTTSQSATTGKKSISVDDVNADLAALGIGPLKKF